MSSRALSAEEIDVYDHDGVVLAPRQQENGDRYISFLLAEDEMNEKA